MNFQLMAGLIFLAIAGFIAFANLKSQMWAEKLGTWAVHTLAFAHDWKYITASVAFAVGVAILVTMQKN
ncbi:hypothetical protein DB346_00300 [Verrucomicrobia bacterium LW23]|nr:hypothetical protein DB346_00300 [Verrucomicrobia bacterium LW23]